MPQPRQWLHDLEHEAASLALWLERSRVVGALSAEEKKSIRKWHREFQTRLLTLKRPTQTQESGQ